MKHPSTRHEDFTNPAGLLLAEAHQRYINVKIAEALRLPGCTSNYIVPVAQKTLLPVES